MVKPRALRRARRVVGIISILVLASCQLFLAPEDTGGGRSIAEPSRELFVIHSLAESLSTVPIDIEGDPGVVDADALLTGAVPNDILRVGPLLVVVVSGENALRTIVEDRLVVSGTIDLGSGRNPMRAASLSVASPLETARWLVAVTNLFTDSVTIVNIEDNVVVAEFSVGPSPQAILALPGSDDSHVRLVVSNTNFRADRPSEIPYGPGSLTELVLTIALEGAGAPAVSLDSTRTIQIEEPDYDPNTEAGINPGELLSLAGTGEILVVGAGVNYTEGGGGADDGQVLILDRDSLAVLQRIAIGGSPATGALSADDAETALYTAGVDGIRLLRRDASTGWETVADSSLTLLVPSGPSGSLFADCLVLDAHLIVADFAGDRLLRLNANTGSEIGTTALSDGPIALLWDDES